MALPVKALLSSAAVVSIGTIGILLVKNSMMPRDWKPLSLDADFETAYSGGYGKKYGRFLVGKENNDEWWKWSFHNVYRADAFDAKSGFGGINSETELKEKCVKAYKGTLSSDNKNPKQIKGSETDSSSVYGENHVWRLCSAAATIDNKPLTIKEVSDKGQAKQASEEVKNKNKETHKDKLLNIESNKWAWRIRNREWMLEESKTGFFFTDQSRVRDACKAAYEKDSSNGANETEPKKDDLLKWCGLEKSSSTDPK